MAETSGLRTTSPTTTSSTILETAKDVEKLFIKKIVERRRAEVEKRRGEIHLTDLTSDCLRRVWYDKHDPLPDDPPDLIRMWQGEIMHEMPLLKEHELELEYKGIKTRVDEYEDGILIEKKFVNFIPRTREELAKYYSHYVKQVEYEAVSQQMVVHCLSCSVIPAPHHLPLDGLPEPPSPQRLTTVARLSPPYGSRKPGVISNFLRSEFINFIGGIPL